MTHRARATHLCASVAERRTSRRVADLWRSPSVRGGLVVAVVGLIGGHRPGSLGARRCARCRKPPPRRLRSNRPAGSARRQSVSRTGPFMPLADRTQSAERTARTADLFELSTSLERSASAEAPRISVALHPIWPGSPARDSRESRRPNGPSEPLEIRPLDSRDGRAFEDHPWRVDGATAGATRSSVGRPTRTSMMAPPRFSGPANEPERSTSLPSNRRWRRGKSVWNPLKTGRRPSSRSSRARPAGTPQFRPQGSCPPRPAGVVRLPASCRLAPEPPMHLPEMRAGRADRRRNGQPPPPPRSSVHAVRARRRSRYAPERPS